MFDFDLTFNIPLLLCTIGYTYGVFFWIWLLKDNLKKIFFGIFITFMLIYSGLGGSLDITDPSYSNYYFIYMGVLSITCFLFVKRKHNNPEEDESATKYNELFINFFNTFGTFIIVVYVMAQFASLFYPEVVIENLINPPKPDVEKAFAATINPDQPDDSITRSLTFVKNLLLPFFVLSLYKYRNDLLKLSFLWFVPLYFTYCASEYLGRTEMATSVLVYIIALYYWNPKYRKSITIISILLGVVAMPLFLIYQNLRSGTTIGNLSLLESIQLLATIELTFPSFFDQILTFTQSGANFIGEFYEYLIMMIVPSFLRFGLGDLTLNYEITGLLLNTDAEKVTWVVLTGIVGESVFVFGTTWFWLHAVTVGVILCLGINYFTKCESLYIFAMYCIATIAPFVARGGTSGAFATLLKSMVYVSIVIAIYRFYTHRKSARNLHDK